VEGGVAFAAIALTAQYGEIEYGGLPVKSALRTHWPVSDFPKPRLMGPSRRFCPNALMTKDSNDASVRKHARPQL
jgi:hypothetical protein